MYKRQVYDRAHRRLARYHYNAQGEAKFPKKLDFLTNALAQLGIGDVDLYKGGSCNAVEGAKNREGALMGLDQSA